jgi:hypothetical protein
MKVENLFYFQNVMLSLFELKCMDLLLMMRRLKMEEKEKNVPLTISLPKNQKEL